MPPEARDAQRLMEQLVLDQQGRPVAGAQSRLGLRTTDSPSSTRSSTPGRTAPLQTIEARMKILYDPEEDVLSMLIERESRFDNLQTFFTLSQNLALFEDTACSMPSRQSGEVTFTAIR
jgi:hypothetical protein